MLKNHRILSPLRLEVWAHCFLSPSKPRNILTFLQGLVGIKSWHQPSMIMNKWQILLGLFMLCQLFLWGPRPQMGLGDVGLASQPGICQQTYLARLGKSLLIWHTCTKTWWNKNIHMPRYTPYIWIIRMHKCTGHYRLEWPSNHSWKFTTGIWVVLRQHA
jgi:hypothetical protein